MDRIHDILNSINKAVLAKCKLATGNKVKNINSACMHFGSEGIVESIDKLPEEIGYVVSYRTTNSGPTWQSGEVLRKTEDQLQNISDDSDTGLDYPVIVTNPIRSEEDEIEEETEEDDEDEDEEEESEDTAEYKNEFIEMNIGSIRAILTHAQNILSSIDNPSVKDNLTESWLQGKIAITEDYMRTIHDFVMFVSENDDEYSDAQNRPGLWENIRKKKEREGDDYRPAKKGDKDRPDPKTWKKLTKDPKTKK